MIFDPLLISSSRWKNSIWYNWFHIKGIRVYTRSMETIYLSTGIFRYLFHEIPCTCGYESRIKEKKKNSHIFGSFLSKNLMQSWREEGGGELMLRIISYFLQHSFCMDKLKFDINITLGETRLRLLSKQQTINKHAILAEIFEDPPSLCHFNRKIVFFLNIIVKIF